MNEFNNIEPCEHSFKLGREEGYSLGIYEVSTLIFSYLVQKIPFKNWVDQDYEIRSKDVYVASFRGLIFALGRDQEWFDYTQSDVNMLIGLQEERAIKHLKV